VGAAIGALAGTWVGARLGLMPVRKMTGSAEGDLGLQALGAFLVGGLATAHLQILTGTIRKMNDFIFLIHDNTGWSILLQESLVQIRIGKPLYGALFLRGSFSFVKDRRRSKSWFGNGHGPRGYGPATKDMMCFVDYGEEIASAFN
jgi:hypothetical protein